jgi:hypothetical protein
MAAWVRKESRLEAANLMGKLSVAADSPVGALRAILGEMRGYLEAVVNASEAKRESATTLGKEVHRLIHLDILGLPFPDIEDKKVSHALDRWRGWKAEHDFQAIASERVVWSPRHFYAGTIDTVAWVDGKLALIDFKTSQGFYKDMALQLAAYAQAWEECAGNPDQRIQQLLIVRLGKDEPDCQVKDFTEWREEAFQVFQALQAVREFSLRPFA